MGDNLHPNSQKTAVKEAGSNTNAIVSSFDPPLDGHGRDLWFYIQPMIRFQIRSPLDLGRLEDLMSTLIFAQTDPWRSIQRRHDIRRFLRTSLSVDPEKQTLYRKSWNKDMSLPEIGKLAETQAPLIYETCKEMFPVVMHAHLTAAIQWWLQNYALVKFYQNRQVDLCQIRSGNVVSSGSDSRKSGRLTRGWSIVASKDISGGSYIYELTGICATIPGDHDGLVSRISVIRLPTGTEHVLGGPLRFLNHDCRHANVAYVYLRHIKGAHAAQATRDIKAGEEILVYYGDDYFEDLRECICRGCREKATEGEVAQKRNKRRKNPLKGRPKPLSSPSVALQNGA